MIHDVHRFGRTDQLRFWRASQLQPIRFAIMAENQMLKTLKSIFLLAAVGVIVGQAGIERRASLEPGNQALPVWIHSQPGQILLRACGNCHSGHTDWPWYSHVAPLSWWIAGHVREGREQLDFSSWEIYSTSQRRGKLESVCGLISTGRMPPWQYTTMHPEAELTEKDKKAVCAWAQEEITAARP